MKSIRNLLIQLSLTLIFVLSGYSYCNAGNKTEIKSEKIVNDTNMCLLDSLNIDSIYISVFPVGDYFIKGNKVYVDPDAHKGLEFEISKNEVDSLIMPLITLYIDKTVPVRLGRKKLKIDFEEYIDAIFVEIKIFTPDKLIEKTEKYLTIEGRYKIFYSEVFNKLINYVFKLDDKIRKTQPYKRDLENPVYY